MSIDKAKLRVTAIDRLRIDTDGKGVTTLVVLNKCPLNCKYCPNPKARTLRNRVELTSPERLCRHLKEDDLYFRASGGGVTFGGGEPLLQADKIKEFKKLCPPEWKINIETSLNVDLSLIKEVADVVDHWMIDIKDMNQKIYKAYTGKSNRKVVKNLKWMAENGLANKMEILIPLIPEYNTLEDIENNKRKLNEIGLTNHNVFSYIITHNERKSPTLRGIPFNKNVRTSK